MVVHIGEDKVIPLKKIIGIFDIDTFLMSNINKKNFDRAKKEGIVEKISDEESKTIVMTRYDDKDLIFLSPISSLTLLKRTDYIKNISNSDRWEIRGEKDGK